MEHRVQNLGSSPGPALYWLAVAGQVPPLCASVRDGDVGTDGTGLLRDKSLLVRGSTLYVSATFVIVALCLQTSPEPAAQLPG